MPHYITYALIAIAAAMCLAVFGCGPLALVVWAYSEWQRKGKQKEKDHSEEVKD